MKDELAAAKERIRQELEEVNNRIHDHQQLAAQLEFNLLRLRAKPQMFGSLKLPAVEKLKLTAAEKFRLCNASEISQQKLGKFIGIRVSDYKHDPQSFVVELTVTNNKGAHVGPYYAAFKKKDDGSYRVIKSQLPHMVIMTETKRNFELGNEQQLGKFVRELRLCCQSYVDRKDQYEDLMAVRDKEMMPTVSCDEGYLFIELGIMLNKEGGKLRIFYKHNDILPHKFTLVLKDAKAYTTWNESLKLLYKCSLVEALGLLSVKESPEETELESDIPLESIPTETSRKSKASKNSSKTLTPTAGIGKNATKTKSTFNFSDSSDDEANRSARMKKKKAKIASNVRRKTYWNVLSQQAAEESAKSSETTEASVASSDISKETKTVQTETSKNPKVTALKKNVQAKTSRKRVNEKQLRDGMGKIRKVTTPPPAETDSELSDDESTSKVAKSGKEQVLAPIFRKSSVAKRSVNRTSSTKPQPSAKIDLKVKKPLLAAIFQKAKRSLDEAQADLSSPTKKQVATADERSTPTKSRRELASTSREQAISQANNSKSTDLSKPTKDTSKKTAKSQAKSAVQSGKVRPAKSATEEPASEETSGSSDAMIGTSKEDNSDTMFSETTRVVSPRKVYRLKLSQDSEPGVPQGRSSMEPISEEQLPAKNNGKNLAASQVSLPKFSEDDLLKLSPSKRNVSEVSVGRELSRGQEKMVGRSPQAKKGDKNTESAVGSKKGSKKPASEASTGLRQSPRKKQDDGNTESPIRSKKDKKPASEASTGLRQIPRRKQYDGNTESPIISKKDKKPASKASTGLRKRKFEDKGPARKSPRKTKGRKKIVISSENI